MTCGGLGRKGYFFTLLTILMFLSLFTMTYFFFGRSMASARSNINYEKISSLFDDVTFDLGHIIGLQVALEHTDPVGITFYDRIPATHDIPQAIDGYKAFLEGKYARDSNLRLTLDAAALSSSTQSAEFLIYPYHWAYGYANLNKDQVWLRNRTDANDPLGINVSIDAMGEGINDIIWLEAENMSADNGYDKADPLASEGHYMERFLELSKDVDFPAKLRYNLWVRSAIDNSSKNFTVEVDGINSSRFNIRQPDATGYEFRWFNDTITTYNITPGVRKVRVYPETAAGTYSVDVVLLTTRTLTLDNVAPIDRPNDPIEFTKRTGEGWKSGIDVRFSNTNVTYYTNDASGRNLTEWNFTFDDGDLMRVHLGAVQAAGRLTRNGMLVVVNSSVNSSHVGLNTTAVFPGNGADIYVYSGATLNQSGSVSRFDRLWFAKG
jgi:hypothetical protein